MIDSKFVVKFIVFIDVDDNIADNEIIFFENETVDDNEKQKIDVENNIKKKYDINNDENEKDFV